ncbi:presqualene diphosphate synthase HpnD [Acidiphilium acidophilum]|uniref:Presqualene diphosphate synthase HpnD n=1 Tax=Acidiphilium acidophilum TaxID=76588 RepID=A0AAW9DR04_ACIAO|nr:presqualene diphosphate synthase HpnD [Acidiphilium acidophilum]MDX5931067.1 presqualene diphosphate synthase HpnD [Acidiphilium acidophilum]
MTDRMDDDAAFVAAVTRAAGTSFYRGMTVLPARRRTAMYGIYAFCRAVDDIADEEAPLETKRAGLDIWRQRIDRLSEGGDDPVTRVLRDASLRYALRQADFHAVIDGMAMDAGAPIIAPDAAFLDLYCDRVASAVGRLAIRVFGEVSPDGDLVAYHLGRALQLTNILRDVGEDAARGRIYLPREALVAAAVPLDPALIVASPGLPHAMGRIGTEASGHYAEAEAAMARCAPGAVRPARMMGAAYRPLLEGMRRRGFRDPTRRPRLPAWRKALLAAQLLMFTDRRA